MNLIISVVYFPTGSDTTILRPWWAENTWRCQIIKGSITAAGLVESLDFFPLTSLSSTCMLEHGTWDLGTCLPLWLKSDSTLRNYYGKKQLQQSFMSHEEMKEVIGFCYNWLCVSGSELIQRINICENWEGKIHEPIFSSPTLLSLFTAVHLIFRQVYILIWAVPGNSVDILELLYIFTKVTKLRTYINIYFVSQFCLFFTSVPSPSVLYICIPASSLHFGGIFPKAPVPWNTVFFFKDRNDFVVWHLNTWGISTELTVWMLTESAGDK